MFKNFPSGLWISVNIRRASSCLPYRTSSLDGEDLVLIDDYLNEHPRSSPAGRNEMRWLTAKPYGNRAGDVLLCCQKPV